MLLTVEYDSKGVVEIHCDGEGLDSLIGRLSELKKRGGHDHLKTPTWAGNELTEEKQNASNELINHLEVFVWPSS
jgi:hypothetical protein